MRKNASNFLRCVLVLLLCSCFLSGFANADASSYIPPYWLSELAEGAKEINLALLKAGSSKSAFLFYTDAHWNSSTQRSPALLKYLYEHTGMTKTFFGGDIVVQEGNSYSAMSYLWNWRYRLKGLPNRHSVVGNHDDGNTIDNLFDEDYVYGYLLAPEETPDIVRVDSGLYYYIDSAAEKTRYFFLDTGFQRILYNPDQLRFLVSSLQSVPKQWHIVVIAHEWYYQEDVNNPDSTPVLTGSGKLVLDVLDAYNQRRNGSFRVYTGADMKKHVNIPYDFGSCRGKVEFCIGGHLHVDFDGSSPKGIPVILVETDSWQVRSGLVFEAGTTSESSVNGVIADYDERKVIVVRIGRGESRTVPLP